MAGVSTYVDLGRTSSIELEPKTLDFHQIQYAREAALYILNTKSMEEAFHIFTQPTQGLEPVTSTLQGRRRNEVQETSMQSEEAEFDDNNDDAVEEGEGGEEFYNNSIFGLYGFRDVSIWPL